MLLVYKRISDNQLKIRKKPMDVNYYLLKSAGGNIKGVRGNCFVN